MKPRPKQRSARPPKRAPSRVLEGKVRDVTDAGDSVVETEAGIVLVSGGFPGESVRVRTEEQRAGVTRGALLAVLTGSPDRIEPACAIAERCGGCPLMGLAPEAQRALKLGRVQRALTGLCADGVSVSFEPTPDVLGYRRRARLGFRKLGQGALLGYHAHGSKQLVALERCPILTPLLAAALERVQARLVPALEGAGEIELDAGTDEQVSVAVRCDAAVSSALYKVAEQLASDAPIARVALHVAGGAPARYGAPHDAAVLASDGLPLSAPAHGFSQVNAAVNARLQALVLELAQPEGARVLELYAGHGNFTRALAAQAAALSAVEGDAAAAQACRENLRVRGFKQARVTAADVRTLELREHCDVVVLDPPRGGCAVLERLVAQSRASRVVYISCHMTTLSRDLRALHAAGWVVDRAHALDMFPQTGHVEAVVRMRKVAS